MSQKISKITPPLLRLSKFGLCGSNSKRTSLQLAIMIQSLVFQGEVNASKVPEGAGVFSYRGDDEHGRMVYDGDWSNKAAHGYGVMKWQNGDR